MPAPAKQPRHQAQGEAYVWLTAMGLTVGLAMILFLLGLVLVKGMEAFWPKRVVQVTLREASPDSLQGSPTLGGEITKRQSKHPAAAAVPEESGDGEAQPRLEWQLFVANKDVYGLGFKFIDVDQVERVEYPAEVIKLERLEYGPAIGYPIALEEVGRAAIPVDDPEFRPELRRLVAASNERRDAIKHIEKDLIGDINREMNQLRLRLRALESESPAASRVETLNVRQNELQAAYEELAARARALREAQEQDFITYRLISGQEKKLPLGQIVHFYYPNELSTLQRVGLFLRNFWVFLSEEPREANTEGGIFPAIFGTFVMTLLMSVAVTPFGVLAAIYLREYAVQGTFVRSVRIAVNNLAGVPSIVFGVFGLGFFVYFMGSTIDSLFFSESLPTPTFGTGGILWASLTLALMTVPVVIVATEEALAAVSRGAREGSLACGASKWQTIQRIVLPAAAPGILTGLILAMARGAGEVAPLMLVGVVKLAPSLPLDLNYPFIHLDQKFMHLGFHIYDLGFQSPDSDAAKPMVFATTLLLIGLVVLLNLSAIIIRERLRRKYATGAF